MAEVVTFERGHKIIISSSRRIQKGEEVGLGGLALPFLYGRVYISCIISADSFIPSQEEG